MKLKDLEKGLESGSCGVGPGKALRSFVVAALGYVLNTRVYIQLVIRSCERFGKPLPARFFTW
jgi:hypothetical protein